MRRMSHFGVDLRSVRPPAVSPSNRGETSSPGEPQGAPVAIDRVSVAFPVAAFDERPGSWERVVRQLPGTEAESGTFVATVTLEGAEDPTGAYVSVQTPRSPGMPAWAKVELNPSRYIDPKGWELSAGVGEALESLEAAWRAAASVVEPACDLEEATVKRLDLAKDFSGAVGLLLPLSKAPVPSWARMRELFEDVRSGGALTLRVGGASNFARAYDKYRETRGAAPEGMCRVELQCREWCERYGGLRSVGDLTEERVRALGADRFGWSNLGASVSASDEVWERVRSCEELRSVS